MGSTRMMLWKQALAANEAFTKRETNELPSSSLRALLLLCFRGTQQPVPSRPSSTRVHANSTAASRATSIAGTVIQPGDTLGCGSRCRRLPLLVLVSHRHIACHHPPTAVRDKGEGE